MRRMHVLAVIAGVGLAAMTVAAAQQPPAKWPNVAEIEKVKEPLPKPSTACPIARLPTA